MCDYSVLCLVIYLEMCRVCLLFLILSFIGFNYETNDEFRACKVLFETNE